MGVQPRINPTIVYSLESSRRELSNEYAIVGPILRGASFRDHLLATMFQTNFEMEFLWETSDPLGHSTVGSFGVFVSS